MNRVGPVSVLGRARTFRGFTLLEPIIKASSTAGPRPSHLETAEIDEDESVVMRPELQTSMIVLLSDFSLLFSVAGSTDPKPDMKRSNSVSRSAAYLQRTLKRENDETPTRNWS